jgi:hypothetical protein
MATKTGRKRLARMPATPVAVRFTADEANLRRLLEARAQAPDRSLSGQIKHYARLAAIAEDNPDLPTSLSGSFCRRRGLGGQRSDSPPRRSSRSMRP